MGGCFSNALPAAALASLLKFTVSAYSTQPALFSLSFYGVCGAALCIGLARRGALVLYFTALCAPSCLLFDAGALEFLPAAPLHSFCLTCAFLFVALSV